MAAKSIDARTGEYVKGEELKDLYQARDFEAKLLLPERIAAMCQDLFERPCEQGSPEQQVIIFCVRDWHADSVALEMQLLYADGCR